MVGWAWNLFDFILVSVQIAEEILTLIQVDAYNDGMGNATLLRSIRLLRAVRVLRVLRVALMAQDLRLLVGCLVYSLKPFFWTVVALFVMIYVAGIYLTQLCAAYRMDGTVDSDFMIDTYGSVAMAMFSLFQGLTGGNDWDVLVRPLINQCSPWIGVGFVAYISFSMLVVLNVVTGTFVQSAITRGEEVKDMQRVTEARRLFRCLDDDASGRITYAEMQKHMEEPAVQAYFRNLDVDLSEANLLFDMLDVDGSGYIHFEEFLNGCIRLQGSAKSLDLLMVTRESRHSFKRLNFHVRAIELRLSALADMLLGATDVRRQFDD
eukprot:gb/GFBE01041009.1/.p1 GENE.gb/GFBE01041009.1/~~gb/GFBE01041009.1/.p1  ORF type:complete len:321 (+),score=59.66 gb/GFBE01041009.1/:1-963(+)